MYQLTNPGIERAAVDTANLRMQQEILPLLSRQHPHPREWNPLRWTVEGMKLALPDALVMELLKSDDLMDMVEDIVFDSTYDALLDQSEAFVTDILASLMGR